MKRVNNLWPELISDKNILRAICEVNMTHRWYPNHRPNRTVMWVEKDLDARIKDLKDMLEKGFEPKPVKKTYRFDKSAGKMREISEPFLWPDQYVHHMLIQVIQPVAMRGMDRYCCGSIRGRGTHYGADIIKGWMAHDIRGTKYCGEFDIHHFYNNIKPEHVIKRLLQIIKDHRTIDLAERIISEGVLIGLYTSQWFANIILQPLDQLIRSCGCRVKHYVRYMDNFTVFGPNKRKLHHLKTVIDGWLSQIGLSLNKNWQVFPTTSRRPQALGYRYGRGFTTMRKRNKLRLTRQINLYKYKKRHGKHISPQMAMSLLSRLGNLKHCNNYEFYKYYYPEKLERSLKNIVRAYARKEQALWNTYTEQMALKKI
jgi:hypothetical protein